MDLCCRQVQYACHPPREVACDSWPGVRPRWNLEAGSAGREGQLRCGSWSSSCPLARWSYSLICECERLVLAWRAQGVRGDVRTLARLRPHSTGLTDAASVTVTSNHPRGHWGSLSSLVLRLWGAGLILPVSEAALGAEGVGAVLSHRA